MLLRRLRNSACSLLLLTTVVAAQTNRIATPVAIPGHVHRYAAPQYDQGRVPGSLPLNDLTLLLKPSAVQQAALEELLAAQQDPLSGQYRQWLSPQEFADRFSPSQNDIAQVTAWLEGQGFAITHVGQSRNWIAFQGTAQQAESAFRTEIHRYTIDGETHFANASDPMVPEALAGLISGFRGLHDFLPRAPRPKLGPLYTGGSNFHYLAPDDIAAVYNLTALFNQGIDGTGQTLAVVGQTAIDLADIQNFRAIFHLPKRDPQVVIVPGKEKLRIVGAELLEADLDLEWAGSVAKNATVIYVAAPNVFDAVQYTVSQKLAPVISMSYGICETGSQAVALQIQALAQQANAEGITWLNASGDSGAASCDAGSVATQGLAVDLPASIPEVTGVGGTEFNDTSGTYWSSANGANGGSALGYIPETAWNDTATVGQLEAGGGGASAFFPKPAWQTGPGVPSTNARYVPDVAMAASAQHDGALVCSGGGCANGSLGGGVVVGGTSLATPIFAGIVALMNQMQVTTAGGTAPGLGNINPRLYVLAQTSTGVFHDITTGNNVVPCQKTTRNCSTGSFGFQAGPGYDAVTGLGSINAYGLATQWHVAQSHTVTVSSIAISPSAVAPGGSATVTVTLTAAAPSGGAGVTLVSSNTAAFPVPASVTVPAGQTAVSVQVKAGTATSTAITAMVTASYGGSSATSPVTISPATLTTIKSIALNLSSVAGPGSVMLTVTLSGPAPAGGSAMALTSSNGAVVPVPTPVTMPAGSASGTLSLTVTQVTVSTNVTLTLSYNGSSAQAAVTVLPAPAAAIKSVAVNPAQVPSGSTATVTVTLTGPAPAGGSTVTLLSSNPAAFPVPVNVAVPAGQSSIAVPVQAGIVTASTAATVTASYNNSSSTAPATVTPVILPTIKSMVLSPATLVGPATITLTVTLSSPAPPGGAPMTFTSSNTVAVKAPTPVTMPAGATIGTLTLSVSRVSTPTVVTLTLGYNNSTQTAKLTLMPK